MAQRSESDGGGDERGNTNESASKSGGAANTAREAHRGRHVETETSVCGASKMILARASPSCASSWCRHRRCRWEGGRHS